MSRHWEWGDRLAALRERGLSVEVSHAIHQTGDEALLLQLERFASDDDLVELSRLWAERKRLQAQVAGGDDS